VRRRLHFLRGLRNAPSGKINIMKNVVRRIASVAAAGLAPLAFVTVISPAVGNADCTFGSEYWDPIANTCRPTGLVLPKNCAPDGWWDPLINDCRPIYPPPPA
jgi:hypothetical protein